MDKVSDYHFELPPELIAQHPAEQRSGSRLLKLSAQGACSDLSFTDLLDEFAEGDLLVLNNTRVIPARVFAKKESGGRIELMLERITGSNTILAQLRASRSPKPGANLIAAEDPGAEVIVTGRNGSLFELEINVDITLVDWFNKVGHMPLPPYIERSDKALDQDRYQTVFASQQGAVAAPTAGLHFDDSMLKQLKLKGVELAEVTLHVGAGTFQPVRVDELKQHQMHSEWVEVTQRVCDKVMRTKQRGNRVFAVGTTVVRSLESAARLSAPNTLEPLVGETDIFIYPGFDFKIVDRLITNFHLPESTLLMLVSAFSGHQNIMRAYAHAVRQRYRFFSYGDAMLLDRQTDT